MEFFNDKSVAVVAEAWFYNAGSVLWPKKHRQRSILLENNQRPPDGTKAHIRKLTSDSDDEDSPSQPKEPTGWPAPPPILHFILSGLLVSPAHVSAGPQSGMPYAFALAMELPTVLI
nr:unnamed protein product [Spirometra erinaceieuropaei]